MGTNQVFTETKLCLFIENYCQMFSVPHVNPTISFSFANIQNVSVQIDVYFLVTELHTELI